MADERLRQLERDFARAPTAEGEVALVLERLRLGVLSEERVRLAAFCGWAGAAEILGSAAPTPPKAHDAWGSQLALWGRPIAIRAVTACTAFALERLPPAEPTRAVPPDDLVEGLLLPRSLQTLAALETWVVRPTAETRKRAARRGKGLDRALHRLTLRGPRDRLSPREAAISTRASELRTALSVVTSNAPEQLRAACAGAVWITCLHVVRDFPEHGRGVPERELIAYALGHDDPVADRVARREAERAS